MTSIEELDNPPTKQIKRSYSLALRAKCRDYFVNGTHYIPEISAITGVPAQTLKMWCIRGAWCEARDLRLKDNASELEAQLGRIQKMIADCTTPADLARLSQAYEKLYGVYAWMRGIARPGVTQTSKPSSRGKSGFESPS